MFSYFHFLSGKRKKTDLPPHAQRAQVAREVGPLSFDAFPSYFPSQLIHSSSYSSELYSQLKEKLYGKELLLEELQVTKEEMVPFLKAGLITARIGIQPRKKGYICLRCGTDDLSLFGSYPCARCQQTCIYCRNCIQMGKISTCTLLFRSHFPEETSFETYPQSENDILQWDGQLSLGQQKASDKIVEAIEKRRELLVWAVCGAGKTEVLFHGMAHALKKQFRVLLATPRTDVVLELLPRLRKVFPLTVISGLYSASTEKHLPASIVVATTHQVMRFVDAFDVVIIDEVDAFPYSLDSSLKYAVAKAGKRESATIYLTATPDPTLTSRVQQKTLPAVKIPRRFHGHPLPVPKLSWCGNWERKLKQKEVPKQVWEWCRVRIESGTPVFLFVPSVTSLQQVTDILKKLHPNIEGVHSADEERLTKVSAFREGTIPILVTTTILERGVTVPRVDVAVIGAEQDIFTESALVQIAGRAGRSHNHPTGDVVYFHYGVTAEMNKAITHIKKMNNTPIR